MSVSQSVSHSIRTRILAAFILSLTAFTGALVYGLVQLSNIGEGFHPGNGGREVLCEKLRSYCGD